MLNKRSQSGLTLVELAVVMTIVAALVALAMPNFSTWLRNTEIRNSAESISNGLQKARNEAVRRNQLVSFSLVSLSDSRIMDNSCALDSEGASWVVSLNSPAGQCGVAPSETTAPMIVETRAGGDGSRSVAIKALNSGGGDATQISFNGLGQVANPATSIATINVSDAGGASGMRNLRVRVTNGGVVRMCDPAVSTSSDPRYCS